MWGYGSTAAAIGRTLGSHGGGGCTDPAAPTSRALSEIGRTDQARVAAKGCRTMLLGMAHWLANVRHVRQLPACECLEDCRPDGRAAREPGHVANVLPPPESWIGCGRRAYPSRQRVPDPQAERGCLESRGIPLGQHGHEPTGTSRASAMHTLWQTEGISWMGRTESPALLT